MQHTPPGYKQTEVGVIPNEWEVCPVRQKGEVITGKALAVNAPGPQRPYLRTKNVFDGRIDIDDVLTMPMTDEQFAQFRIRNGDVLLNEGQSLELVGRCAIYQDEYPEPCAIQNALLRFRARPGVSEKFATYLFRHCQQTGAFARIALQTTSVAHLGGLRFERLCLPWPTEAEQRAIAGALSDVDALLGAVDQLLAKKRDLKQATMQQLLTGQTRLPGFHGEWEVKKLGDVATIKDGTHQTPKYVSSGVPFFSVEHVTSGDFKNTKFISEEEHRFLTRSFKIEKGDILMTRIGSIGDCKLIDWDVEASFYVSLALLKIHAGYSAAFICHYSKSAAFQKDVELHSLGSAIPKKINLGPISDVQIKIPAEVAEQTAIAEVLTEMDAELAALEQRRAKTRALKQGMMQELLTGKTRLI